MTSATPPADLLEGVVRVLEPAFRIDRLVAATVERVVYHAWDRVLKRHVALYAHLAPDVPGRAWFLRETETLAALDHPTIRHVYAAAIPGSFAYRTTNWVEGESLADALRRGPRPIPTAHTLVRDLLSAAEDAHARGVILRRIVPLTLMLELSCRAVITDLRYANWCLPYAPPEERGAGGAFVAPEVRAGGPGEPGRDVAPKAVRAALAAEAAGTGRLRRQARVAARRRRPSIVSLHDIMGRAGREWYTRERVRGTNLAQLGQAQGPLSVDQTVRVL